MVARVLRRREGTLREPRVVLEVAVKEMGLIVVRAIPLGISGVPRILMMVSRIRIVPSGDRNGWNTTHPTKYHQEAQEPNWSIHTLAAIDPQNKLVLAVQGRGAAIGGTEVIITTAGLTQNPMLTAGQAAVFDQFSSLAPSEEVKQTIANLWLALHLN